MKITVFGAGYVGLVTGACLSEMGNHVVCLDVDPRRVALLQGGDLPIHEPGLQEIVARNMAGGRLQFTGDVEHAVGHGTLLFIAVGTPPGEDGSADLSHVLAAAAQIGRHMTDYKVVIDKSQTGDERQGEIVIYGPNVMQGYHNRDEENKSAFTEDRGFRTGDLGYLDDDGYLFITGRIKEQYKLENGKYVAPAPLEEQLKLSPFIVNAMVYGDNRLYNVALIVPDLEAVTKWAGDQGLSFDSPEKLVDSPKVKELEPQQKAVLHEVTGTWPDDVKSWNLQIVVTSDRGDTFRNQVTWR